VFPCSLLFIVFQDRHCERSEAIHSSFVGLWIASSFALRATADAVVASAPRKKLELGKAAATIKTVVARLDRAIQYAAASHLSQTSLEYWVARSSRAMTAVFVSFIRVGSKVGTELAIVRSVSDH
jgi:hypothetical protein